MERCTGDTVGVQSGDDPVMLAIMKAMSKSALAKAAGVNRRTLMRWLKQPYMQQQMERFNLSPKQQKLPAKLVKIICEHYVIDLD